MTFKPKSGAEDLIEFSLDTLDSDIKQNPDAHIFFESKANWVQVNDDLPKFAEGRGGSKQTQQIRKICRTARKVQKE